MGFARRADTTRPGQSRQAGQVAHGQTDSDWLGLRPRFFSIRKAVSNAPTKTPPSRRCSAVAQPRQLRLPVREVRRGPVPPVQPVAPRAPAQLRHLPTPAAAPRLSPQRPGTASR